MMTSRERVERALNHEEPDRVPLELGATMTSGMQVNSVIAGGLGSESRQLFDDLVAPKLAAIPREVDGNSPEVLSEIVPPNSEWKWLYPTDGIDPQESDPDFHTTFFTDGFDDAGWKTGKDGWGKRAALGVVHSPEKGGLRVTSLVSVADSHGAPGGLRDGPPDAGCRACLPPPLAHADGLRRRIRRANRA